jgi:hypothetical protein
MANFRLWVDKTYKDGQRMDFFRSFVEGKKVLHVGFVDWPKTRPEKNLHRQAKPHAIAEIGTKMHFWRSYDATRTPDSR